MFCFPYLVVCEYDFTIYSIICKYIKSTKFHIAIFIRSQSRFKIKNFFIKIFLRRNKTEKSKKHKKVIVYYYYRTVKSIVNFSQNLKYIKCLIIKAFYNVYTLYIPQRSKYIKNNQSSQ